MGRLTRIGGASICLFSISLLLTAGTLQAHPTACPEVTASDELYSAVQETLGAGNCACAREFFTRFARQNVERLETNRDFFDQVNHEIFRCEVENLDLTAGRSERRVRGLGL